jgi:hypothetical protein
MPMRRTCSRLTIQSQNQLKTGSCIEPLNSRLFRNPVVNDRRRRLATGRIANPERPPVRASGLVSTLQRIDPGARDLELACGATDVKRRKPIETGRKQTIHLFVAKKWDIRGLSFDYLPAMASSAKGRFWNVVILVPAMFCSRFINFYF